VALVSPGGPLWWARRWGWLGLRGVGEEQQRSRALFDTAQTPAEGARVEMTAADNIMNMGLLHHGGRRGAQWWSYVLA